MENSNIITVQIAIFQLVMFFIALWCLSSSKKQDMEDLEKQREILRKERTDFSNDIKNEIKNIHGRLLIVEERTRK